MLITKYKKRKDRTFFNRMFGLFYEIKKNIFNFNRNTYD